MNKIEKQHFEYHHLTVDFDYWCVAHNLSEFYPKYLQEIGEGPCHDPYCSEYCRQCPKICPIKGCNQEEYWDSDEEQWINDPNYKGTRLLGEGV